MGGQRLSVSSSADHSADEIRTRGVPQPDVSAMASLDGGRLCVLVWHYADDDIAGPPAATTLTLHHVPWAISGVQQFCIDQRHSNAYALWQRLGSPPQPTSEQYRQLQAAGALAEVPAPQIPASGVAPAFILTLPRQGVMLMVVSR